MSPADERVDTASTTTKENAPPADMRLAVLPEGPGVIVGTEDDVAGVVTAATVRPTPLRELRMFCSVRLLDAICAVARSGKPLIATSTAVVVLVASSLRRAERNEMDTRLAPVKPRFAWFAMLCLNCCCKVELKVSGEMLSVRENFTTCGTEADGEREGEVIPLCNEHVTLVAILDKAD